MKANALTSRLELPCTVLCGPKGECKLSGTAVWIESARMVLCISGRKRNVPRVGDEVRLNVHLPAAEQGIAAKDLSVRARVVEVNEVQEGFRTFVLNFRRVQFKDRDEEIRPGRMMHNKWEM
jgi:hypothetical protein